MTIATEVQRIKDNIANTYTALGEKGAIIPEIQNSANLADTVATVTTGGGGGSSREPLFDKLDSIMEQTRKANNSSQSFIKLPDSEKETYFPNNFIFYSVSQSCANAFSEWGGIVGIVFSNNAPNTIYIKVYDFYIPENATYELISGDSGSGATYKITFTDEKYIIFSKTSMFNFRQSHLPIYLDSSCTANYQQTLYNYIEYVSFKACLDTDMEQSYPEYAYGSHFGLLQKSKNLKEIKLIDWKISVGSLTNSLSLLISDTFFLSPYIDMVKLFEDTTVEGEYIYGTTSLSGGTTKNLLTNVSAKAMFSSFMGRFPFVLDLSSFTDSTLYMNADSITSSSNKRGLSSMYDVRILPSANSSLNFTVNTTSNICITPESLRFIAEKSPTVSGKTLTIGSYTKEAINLIDPTIISTLESKGWTVS